MSKKITGRSIAVLANNVLLQAQRTVSDHPVYQAPARAHIVLSWNDQPLKGNELLDGQRLHLKRAGTDLHVLAGDDILLVLEEYYSDPYAFLEGDHWALTDTTTGAAISTTDTAAVQPMGAEAAAPSTVANDGEALLPVVLTWEWSAGIVAAALAAQSSHSDPLRNIPTASPVSTLVSGTVVAGPVIPTHGLSIRLYAADGQTVLATTLLDTIGTFSVDVGDYGGVVVAVVIDRDTGLDYLDEASGQARDLQATLSAAGVAVRGQHLILNINALTTLAAQKAGVGSDGHFDLSASSAATLVQSTNTAVAQAFGLTDILGGAVVPTVNADGTANAQANLYGKVLAALSGMDALNGNNTQATLNALSSALDTTAALPALTDAAKAQLLKGGYVAGTAVPEIAGNTQSTPNAQAVVDAYQAVMTGAAGGPAPSRAQLDALGVSGVSNDNLAAVQAAIAATANDGSGVDTLAKLQAIVSGALNLTFTGISRDTGISATDLITQDNTLTFNGTSNAADGTRVKLVLDIGTGAETTLTTSVIGGLWSVARTTALADGTHTLDIALLDSQQAVIQTVAQRTLTVDTSATLLADGSPDTALNGKTIALSSIAPDTGNNSSDFTTSNGNLIFSGTSTAPDGTAVALSVDGQVVYTSVASGQWQYDYSAHTLPTGTHQVRVSLVDAAGNSAASAQQTVVIDTTPLTLLSKTTGDIGKAADLTLVFNQAITAQAGKAITLIDDHGTVETISVTDTSRVSISGNTVTLNPSADLVLGTSYHATIDAGAFQSSTTTYGGLNDNSWTFRPADPAISVNWIGAGVDASNGINAAELAQLGLSGAVSSANLSGVSNLAITRIAFSADDGSSFVLTNNLPTVDAANGYTWTLANANNWTSQLQSGKQYTVSVTLESDVGGTHLSTTAYGPTSLLDNTVPTLSIASDVNQLKAGETATLTFTFSEPPTGFTESDITVAHGALSSFAPTNDPKVYTAVFTPDASFSGTGSVSVPQGSYTDHVGNAGGSGTAVSLSIDTLLPAVTSVAITGVDSANAAKTTALDVGDKIQVTLTMSEATTVTGSPTYTVDVGGVSRTATYSSGSGTTALVFCYTLVSGDNDMAGGIDAAANALLLSGGTLTDAAGNAAALDTPAISANTNTVSVDTTFTALQTLKDAAQNDTASSATTPLAVYARAGVTGITDAGAINSALNSATVTGTSADTTGEVQAIVNAYNAVLALADGGVSAGAPVTATQYAQIGVTGIDATTAGAPQVSAASKAQLLSDAIDRQASTAVDTVPEIQALADAVSAVMTGAAGGTAPTRAQLEALGITGVTNNNLATVLAAIAATPNDGSQIDSLAELQSVVTSAVNAATANALSTISSYAGNNSASAPAQPMGTPPTLADYANAGVTGVDANNLDSVNDALSTAAVTRALSDTASELQTIVDAYTAVLALAAPGTGTPVTAMQLQAVGADIGSAASTATHLNLLNSILDAQGANGVDTVAEINTLADMANAVQTVVAGGTSAHTLVASDFNQIGLHGVTNANLSGILASLAEKADDGSGTDSLAKLQKLIDTYTATPLTAVLTQDTGFDTNDHTTSNAAITFGGSLLSDGTRYYSVDGGAYTTTYTAPTTQGAHTVSVKQIDSAGNSGQATVLSFTLDTVAPIAPTLAQGTGVASGATAAEATQASGVVTVTAEAGATTMVTFTNGSSTVTKTVTGTGSAQAVQLSSADLATLGDGTISVSATATDAAGNTSTASTTSFTLDTSAPTAPTLAQGTDVAGGATAAEATQASGVVTVSAEAGATTVVTFTNGSSTVTKTVTGTGSAQAVQLNSADLATLGDGAISVSATATDAAGNTSAASTTSFTLDTSAPAAPTLAQGTGVAGGATSTEATQASGVVTVNAETGATTVVTFTNGANTVSKTVTGTGSAQAVQLSSADLATLGNGTINVSASTTDAAGNTSAAGTTSFTLDTSAPTAPTLVQGMGVAGGATATEATQASGVVTVSAEAGTSTTVTFTNGSSTVTKTVTGTGSAQAVQLTSADLATLGDGAVSVSATTTDTAGNTSAASTTSFTLDTSAPTAPTLAQGTGVAGGATAAEATQASGVVTVNAQAGASTVVTFTNGANTVNKTVTGTGSAQAVQLTSAELITLGDGAISVSATITDAAGNTSAAGTTSFTLDTAAPTAPTLAQGTGVAGGATAPEATQASGVVTVNAESGATTVVTFTNGANTVTKTVTGTGSAQAVQLTSADLSTLGDGTVSVSASATDAAGNASSAGTTSFTLDTSAPTAPTLAQGTGVAGGATAAEATQASGVITVSTEAGATTTITFTNGANTVTKTVTGTGSAQAVQLSAADLTTLGDGTINVSATATDAAGNASSADTASFTLDTSAPNQPSGPTSYADDVGSITSTASTAATTDDTTPGVQVGAGLTDTPNLYVNGLKVNATYNSTTGTLTPITALNAGTYNLTYTLTDAAGNESAQSPALNLTVDTNLPTLTIGSIAGDAAGATGNGIYDGAERGSAPTSVTTLPVISGSSTYLDGQTVTVTLNTVSYTTTVQSGGAWSVQLSDADAVALNHGNTYSVYVSGTSTTGNTASDSNNSLVVNTAQPDIPTILNTFASTLTPTLSGTAQKFDPSNPGNLIALQAGDLLRVTINGISVSGSIGNLPTGLSYDATQKTWQLDTAATPNFGLQSGQSYNVAVQVTTGGGTVFKNDISSNELVIDTTAPTIALLPLSGDGYLNANEAGRLLTIAGTTSAQVGSTVTLTGLDGVTRTALVLAGSGATQQFSIDIGASDVAALTDGNKTVSVSVVNQFGLSGSSTATLTVDTSAPSAPSGITITPSGGTVVANTLNSTNTAIDLSATITAGQASGGKAEFYVNGALIGTDTSIASGDINVSCSTSDGSPTAAELQAAIASGGSVSVKLYDAAGNVVTANGPTLTRDITPPGAPTLAQGTGVAGGATAAEATQASGVVTVSAETGATTVVTFTNGANTVTKTVTGTGSAQVVQLTSADLATLGDGAISVSATATDAAGNTSTVGTTSFTLDTSAPTAPTLAQGTGVTGGATAAEATQASGVVTVSAEAGAATTVTFTNGSNAVTKTVTGTGSAQAVQLTSADLATLGDGTISVSATATDAAGNTSTASTTSFTLDTSAPTAPTLAQGTGVAGGATATEATQATGVVTVSAEAGATTVVTFTNGSHTVTKTVTGTGSAQAVQLSSADLATLGDGAISVSATATDAAGNTSAASTTSFTLDTSAPTAPTLVQGTGVAGGATSTEATQASGVATVSAEAGASTVVTFTNGSHTVTKTVTGTGSAQAVQLSSADLATLGDGTISVSATATDAAGNTSTASTTSFTLDTSAPTAPTLAQGTGVAGGATATEATQASGVVTVSAEAGSATTVTFTNGNSTVTKTVTGTGSVQAVQLTSADLATLGDGPISVSATATDAAGNTSTGGTTSFTLDTVAPTAPSLALGSGVANGATAAEATQASGVVTVNAEAGATTTVSFTNGSHTVTKTVTGTGSAQAVQLSAADLATLGDGTISVSAAATDAAGNVSSAGTGSFTLDTSAPTAPTLAQGTGVAGGATATEATQASGVVTVSAEAGATTVVTFTNGANTVTKTVTGTGSAQAVQLTSADLSTLGNGTVSVSASATDAAGNTSTAGTTSFTLDTSAPTAPTLAQGIGVAGGATATEATQASGVVTVSAEAGATTTVTFTNGSNTVTKTVTGTGAAQAVQLTSADLTILGDGIISVSATATDAAGNTSVAGTTSFTLDTTPPATPAAPIGYTDNVGTVQSTASTAATTDDTTPGLNIIIAPLGTTPSLYVDGVKVAATYNGTIGILTPTTALADGAHTLSYTLTDAAGNESGRSPTLSVTVDTIAPTAPTLAQGSGVAGGATAAEATQASGVVTVNAQAGASTVVTFTNGSNTVTKTVTGTGAAQAVQLTSTDLTTLGNGAISVSATATDAAGNASSAGTTNFTLDTVAPLATTPYVLANVNNDGYVNKAELNNYNWSYLRVSWQPGAQAGDRVTYWAVNAGNWTGAPELVNPTTYTLTAADITRGYLNVGDQNSRPVNWSQQVELHAYVTDSAGNQGPTGVNSTLWDPTAPNAPVLAQGTGVAGGATAAEATQVSGVVTVSAEAGATTVVTFTNGSHTVTKTVTGTGAAQAVQLSAADLATLGDGTISVSATATDAAGNTSSAGTGSFTLDTVAPAAPSVATLSSDGRQMTGTAEAGSTVSVKATNGTTLGTALADANGNFSITLPSAQADGTALALTATDTAGNTSASASVIKSAPTIVALDQNLVQVEGAGTYESPAVLQALADGRWIAVWSNNGLSDDTATMTMQARLMNADGSPASNQFQLSNTAVDGADGYDIPNFAITQLSGGNIVVSWVRSGVSAPQDQPIATIVKPDGTIVATDIKLVQVEGPGTFESPAVIKALADGRWIAVWSNNGLSDDNTNMQIQARLVNADGTFASNQFQVGTIAVEGTDGYDVPNFAVTQLAGGNIVVTWERSYANGAPRDQPIASIIKSDGTVLSSDIQLVQTEGPGTYESPAVIQALADGRWLAVWSNNGSSDDNTNMLMQARFMNADGTPAGNQFQVGAIAVDGTDYDVPNFAVTQLAGGNIVVTWVRNTANGAPSDQPIATIIKPDGTVVDSNIQMVQNEGPGTYESPAVIQALADGRWIAVWSNNGTADDNVNMLVQARVFNADGTAASNQFQVGSIAVDGSGYDVPNFAVTQLAGGNVVVTWERNNANGAPYDQPIFSVIDVATFRATPYTPAPSFIGGSQANSGLGLSLNSAGDFNGDGYQDFIVSAPQNQYAEGTANSADIYLIYGTAGGIPSILDIDKMTASQGIHYTNTASGYDGYTGTVVKGIGDLNGDGYGDVVIGGLLGRNYVLWGGANKAGSLDLATMNAGATANGFMMYGSSEWFGDGMASADLNRDGISDLIIGDSALAMGTDYGAVYVVYGHTGAWTNMVGTTTGMTGATGAVTTFKGGTYFGDRIGVVGDVNGDGYVDFLVNAPAADGTGGVDSGVSTLVFGTASGYPTSGVINLGTGTTSTSYGIKISGAEAYEYLGDIAWDRTNNFNGDAYYSQALTVGSIGDFNGDGVNDFMIGSPGWGDAANGYSAPGRAYIYYGHTGSWSDMSASTASTAGKGFILTASGIGTNSNFGFAMAGGGDYNGDGYADFLVTAVNADTNGLTDNGAVWLVFGKSGGYSGTVDVTTLVANGQALQWNGSASGVFMGTNVAMGDWNKDGYADVAIPQWESMSNGADKAGSFKIYYGNAAGVKNPSGITPVTFDLNGDGQIGYGHVVMDVNGDGQKELTAWTDAQDGVLVWDKLGDGVVHDSSQYAFSQYGGNTDLQGLAAAFDTNKDGSFDSLDALFKQFAVWRDANQNGVSDAGEVRSLLDLGITAIHLQSDGVVRAPAEGVLEFGQTSATLSDGSTVLVADAQFAYTEEPRQLHLV